MKLTKFSQRNLQVIENFLLYAGLEEQYSQAAIDYISEDHVDGEGAPEAIRQFAEDCELIREAVDLGNNVSYAVYADSESKLIYAVPSDESMDVLIYKLIKPQEIIEVEHRDEILDYCLAKKTKDDEVCLGDIFVHGKYVEQVYPI